MTGYCLTKPCFFSRCPKDANVDSAEVAKNGDFLILVDRGVSTDVEIGVPGATAGVF
jgi:hypothetical protein